MGSRLKKQLGLVDGISYVAGAIIGSGIFISPSPVLAGSGGSKGLALLIWALCGLAAMLEALCFVELAQRVKKSGGFYIFILEAFGDSVSFVFLWLFVFIIRPLSIGLGSLAAATYMLRPIFQGCPNLAPDSAIKLIAIIILVVYVWMNCYSVKHAACLQIIILACKLSALALIVIFGFVTMSKGNGEEDSIASFSLDSVTMDGLIFAVYVGVFAYGGGPVGIYAYEEYINPRRDIPMAMIIGHVIPIVVYLLVNVAYYSVLTTEEITSGIAVAVTFAERCMGSLKWIIVACIVISTSATINNNCFATSRTIYVASREKNFPGFLSMMNVHRKTLVPALITICCLATAMIMMMGLLSTLKVYTLLSQTYRFVAVIGLFKLRKTHNPDGVIKLPTLVPVLYLGLMVTMVTITVIYNPSVVLLAAAFASSGVLVKILGWFGKPKDSYMRKIYDTLHGPIVHLCRAVLQSEFTDAEPNPEPQSNAIDHEE